MDPFSIIMGIIGAASAIAGTTVGAIQRGDAAGKAEKRDQILADTLARMGLPELKEYIPAYLEKSDAGELQADPQFKEAQMAALDRLKQVDEGGGFTMSDRAALNKIQGEVGQQQKAAQEGLTQQMQARGALDSGAHLQMALANQQAGANRAQQAGLDVAGQAQMRALNAMVQRGQMAGQAGAQDFNQRMASAQARDYMRQYNTGLMNQAKLHNLGLSQQQWENQLRKLQVQAGQAENQSRREQANAQAAAATMGGLGQAGMQGAQLAYGYLNQPDAPVDVGFAATTLNPSSYNSLADVAPKPYWKP